MKLYLSKVLIERARPLQPYEWHQLLWTLFPAPAGTPRPYLFRVEGQEPGATQVLVQSNREPQAGAAVDHAQVRVLATRPLQPPQGSGQRLQFQVTVNPTLQRRVPKAEPPGAGPTRRHLVRIGHYQEEEQRAWLESRLAGAAQLEDVLIRDQRTLRFRTTRQQVLMALGRRPARDLPALVYTEVATLPALEQLVSDNKYDVIVLDGEAAPAGGMGIARQLKDELFNCPPILLLIARPQDGWLATWSRADAVSTHPIEAMALARAMDSLIRPRVPVTA